MARRPTDGDATALRFSTVHYSTGLFLSQLCVCLSVHVCCPNTVPRSAAHRRLNHELTFKKDNGKLDPSHNYKYMKKGDLKYCITTLLLWLKSTTTGLRRKLPKKVLCHREYKWSMSIIADIEYSILLSVGMAPVGPLTHYSWKEPLSDLAWGRHWTCWSSCAWLAHTYSPRYSVCPNLPP